MKRFWDKVNKAGPIMPGMRTCCWEWSAGTNPQGYGWMWFLGRPQLAHRVAWHLNNGSFPTAPLQVLHQCDNPKCMRHLFAGTNADNVADKVAKGRQRGAVGDRNASAKLGWAAVALIRAQHRDGFNNVQIARSFGVHHSMVSRIVRNEAWRIVA